MHGLSPDKLRVLLHPFDDVPADKVKKNDKDEEDFEVDPIDDTNGSKQVFALFFMIYTTVCCFTDGGVLSPYVISF
jgi:hypothetical protein